MDVRLSPEQRALRDSAAQVLDRLGPHTVRELDDDERAAKLRAAVETAGWLELRVADDGGGPLASGVETAIVAEELGRGLADIPFLGPTLAADLRRRAGAPPGTLPETVALSAGLGGPAVATGGAAPDGAIAIDAPDGAGALVLVPTEGGWALGTVEAKGGDGRVDLTRLVAELEPGAAVVAVADQGRVLTEDDIMSWTALGLALTSADLVGAMRGAVDLACGYAKERTQYGSPIGSFQAVQHLLADALVSVEGSRSVALHAGWTVDALSPQDALASGAVAKAYSARAARTVCETAIQVHGGIGNTWECLAHVFLRRALLSTDVLGGVDVNLGRVLGHQGIGSADGLR